MTANAIRKPDISARPSHWYRRHPIALFLVALVLVFVTTPFTEEFKDGDLVEAINLTAVLLAGLVAMGERRRTLGWGILIVTCALVGKWMDYWHPEVVPDWCFLVPGVLFLAIMMASLLRFILRAPHVNSEVLSAGISGYLLLGLMWTSGYILVAQLSPGAFVFSAGPESSRVMKGFTAFYFSFITLSTVGYGDIVPVSGAARMLATMEAMIGVFYVAVLISRLVAMYSHSQPPAGEPPSSDQT